MQGQLFVNLKTIVENLTNLYSVINIKILCVNMTIPGKIHMKLRVLQKFNIGGFVFDVSSYSNGFGVVLVPFVIGIIIRSILSALNSGSVRFMSFLIVGFLVFSFSPGVGHAGTLIGVVESVFYDGSSLSLASGSEILNTDNLDFKGVLDSAFVQNQQVSIVYDDLLKTVQSVSINSNSGLDSKNFSLFLGGIGCLAFALGVTMRI